jgi:Raf kinase inhibitor-like YbhB/YbcL family protein
MKVTNRIAAVLVAPLTLVAAAALADPPRTLQVTSGMFRDGEALPLAMTCDGGGIPPMLTWAGAPTAAKSFAVEVRDLDAPDGKLAQWIVSGIPKNVNAIGEVPEGAVAGLNRNGDNGWAPPCSAAGETHRYAFTVFALDMDIASRDFTHDKLEAALKGHVLMSGEIVGWYTRL